MDEIGGAGGGQGRQDGKGDRRSGFQRRVDRGADETAWLHGDPCH
ncbi:hypothetical protein ACIP68_38475 [Streptomyces griseoviridis]